MHSTSLNNIVSPAQGIRFFPSCYLLVLILKEWFPVDIPTAGSSDLRIETPGIHWMPSPSSPCTATSIRGGSVMSGESAATISTRKGIPGRHIQTTPLLKVFSVTG